MSVKDVTNLRKEGKLQEAYDLALQELNEDPNEWTNMSMFWVLRDYAQRIYIPANNLEKARICLDQMRKLLPVMIDDSGAGERAYQALYKQILPNASEIKAAVDLSKSNPIEAYNTAVAKFGNDGRALDRSLHEDFGWVIYRYLKANNENLTNLQIRELLRDYMQLENERPSLLHSVILNFALNLSKANNGFNFYNFLILWGINNLREEDFENGYKDGHDIPSLVNRLCKTIIDSEQKFNVSEFVGEFSHKSIVVEGLRQYYFWKLMNLYKENQLSQLWESFEYYANEYSALGASHWHSEILKIANRFMVNEHSFRFCSFVRKWYGNGNFQGGDWRKEKTEDGKEFPSLVVKTAKKCYETVKAAMPNGVEDETLKWLKELLEQVSTHETEDDWSIRNYANVCLWCGDEKQAIATYKSLLTRMGDKYYFWSELADCIKDDNQLRIGLLLKAKSLERNEDFLGDIHLSLASLWQESGHSAKAKQELDAYIKHRKEKGWSVSDRYREISSCSFVEDKSERVNFLDYIHRAEDFVYEDYPWVYFVLTEKWTANDSESCNLYNGNGCSFTVKTKRFPILRKTKVGEIIQFRCKMEEELLPDSKYHSWMQRTIKKTRVVPLVAQTTDKEAWSLLPVTYGVIDYINESKSMLHILTQDSIQVFSKYKKGEAFVVDTFVKFRMYEEQRNEESRSCAVNVVPCPPDEALPHMKTIIVVVDDVNEEKKLFHVVLGPGKVSDIVRYEQTDIRPSIGDFLNITYCIKKNKEGKKRIKFLDIKKTDAECENVTKTVTGRLQLKYRDDGYDENEIRVPDFAFVQDYYVHRRLLKKHGIVNDCDVVAKLVLGGDDNWKVYDLEIVNY